MKIYHVDKIIKEMDNGCTKPYLAKLSNNNDDIIYAVIKLKDNEQGVLSVINELISYKLAEALNILMPACGIARIDEKTECYSGLDLCTFGSCFYSTYKDDCSIINDRIMKFVYTLNS